MRSDVVIDITFNIDDLKDNCLLYILNDVTVIIDKIIITSTKHKEEIFIIIFSFEITYE
jgi:hypothetical protein